MRYFNSDMTLIGYLRNWLQHGFGFAVDVADGGGFGADFIISVLCNCFRNTFCDSGIRTRRKAEQRLRLLSRIICENGIIL